MTEQHTVTGPACTFLQHMWFPPFPWSCFLSTYSGHPSARKPQKVPCVPVDSVAMLYAHIYDGFPQWILNSLRVRTDFPLYLKYLSEDLTCDKQ